MKVVLVLLKSRHRADKTFASTDGGLLPRNEIREHVDRRRDSRQQFVLQGAEFEALGHLLGRRFELVGVHGLKESRRRGEEGVVRAQELVRGANEKVSVDRLHVDRCMGREVHPIDVEEGICLMDGSRDRGEIWPGAKQVRGPGHRDESRTFIDEIGNRPWLQRRRCGVKRGPAHCCPRALRRSHPRPDVRIVVEPRDDDLVAGTPVLG